MPQRPTRPLVAMILAVLFLACADGSDPGWPGTPGDIHGDVRVVVLTDTLYVDYRQFDPTAEGSNILGSFEALGYDTRRLNDLSAASLHDALLEADVLVIPEINVGGWSDSLRSLGIDTVITDFVHQGGVLVNGWYVWPLDSLFGWHVFRPALKGNVRFLFRPEVGSGSPFDGGPDSLASNNETFYVNTADLPAGAIAPWRNDSSYAPLFAAPVGHGWVVWLGWDWYRAAPVGDRDGGWLSVLDRLDRFAK